MTTIIFLLVLRRIYYDLITKLESSLPSIQLNMFLSDFFLRGGAVCTQAKRVSPCDNGNATLPDKASKVVRLRMEHHNYVCLKHRTGLFARKNGWSEKAENTVLLSSYLPCTAKSLYTMSSKTWHHLFKNATTKFSSHTRCSLSCAAIL